MKDRNNKVIIIGPYPPPYGGISVHIERIYEYIKDYPVQIYDSSSPNSSASLPGNVVKLTNLSRLGLFLKPHHLIHYHSTSIRMRILLGLVAIFNPLVFIHVHGASLVDQITTNNFKGRFLKVLLKKVNLISSNPQIAGFIDNNLSCRAHYQYDAFIPPKYNERVVEEVMSSIKWPNTKYVISMGGWFAKYKSKDLYGYDLMLSALNTLRTKGMDVSIVASVNGINDRELYESFIQKRDQYSLERYFYLITEDLPELYPILLESDLFVRPTNTDGNAVSIKEALWFEVPVLASDVVSRPKHTSTFKNRDVNSLTQQIETLLLNSEQKHNSVVFNKKFEHPMIKEIYGFK